jgi:hypothetical protein
MAQYIFFRGGNAVKNSALHMELVFKITNSTPSNPAEIGDTNFSQHYSGVNRSMAWGELSPAIRQATEKYIVPYLGEEFYSELASDYNTGATLSGEMQKALTYLQDASAYYAIYHILPEKTGVVASIGAVQNTPTEGSGQPMSQWSWKALRGSALDNGDRFLDLLLTFLEKQVVAGNAAFHTFKDSAAYKAKGSAFFPTTADLNALLNIQESRRSFLGIIKYIRAVEEDVLFPILCGETFEALTSGGTLSEDNALLRDKVRKAVAHLGLAKAIPHHRIVIDGDGFRVVSQTDGFDDRRNQTNNVHENAILALKESAEAQGKKYLAELQVFLRSNAEKYPVWAASPCNAVANTTGHSIVISPDRKGAVGLF